MSTPIVCADAAKAARGGDSDDEGRLSPELLDPAEVGMADEEPKAPLSPALMPYGEADAGPAGR